MSKFVVLGIQLITLAAAGMIGRDVLADDAGLFFKQLSKILACFYSDQTLHFPV
jgi:hypothetical protein